MEEWYAVQSKPRKEFYARGALDSVKGARTYLPVLHVKAVNPRARNVRPFFPGYLFVRTDLEQVGLSTLQWVPGVARIVCCGAKPVAIPERVIEDIRLRVDLVQREDPSGLGRFRQGDRVCITAGPFEGFEGMFDTRIGAQMRVRVLVEFLGRLTAADLDVRSIEKIASTAA